MLGPWARMDARFFGQLLDNLSNAHAVIVKAADTEGAAQYAARKLRNELPPDAVAVGILEAPELRQWLVMAYNVTPYERRRPVVREAVDPAAPNAVRDYWVGLGEVARVLRLTRPQARNVVRASGVETRREGGRSAIMMRQSDLPVLINRPNRWKRRRPA
ncbi:hypothetical protein NTR1_88 [Nocardia phage NTR1]|nr:hypothetical protein NTR1_88 [Nocardia phage NTR1]